MASSEVISKIAAAIDSGDEDCVELRSLKQDLSSWRLGLTAIPQTYLQVHEYYAREDAARVLSERGWTLVTTTMKSDGARFLRLICEDRDGELVDLRWSDSNGGSWFARGLSEVAPRRPGFL